MKFQAGLLHLDGRPASPEDLDKLLREHREIPAEISGHAASGSMLMVYKGDRITEEESSEVQPLEDRGYILTWDGRLDNRERFSRCFQSTPVGSIPDPVVVLKAYQSLGEAVFPQLIGEFALTLWCENSRTLFFVRSTCGARPLYYVVENGTLMWSSHFGHLVRESHVDLTVNDTYVLQYLVTTPDVTQTPLTKVRAIPPNRAMRFENGILKSSLELWSPCRVVPLHYRRDEEYEEDCREKITDAVRVRLRSKYPVFSELSGGLDSSTIALSADHVLRNRNESPHNLQTVSCVYEESRSADEHSFIRAVEKKREIATHLIREKDQRITLGLEKPSFTGLPHTLHCFPGRYEIVSALMREFDSRVLLTGRGGDHLFWSAPQGEALVADELVRLNLVSAHRQCRIWSRAANTPYFEFLSSKAFRKALGRVFPGMYSVEPPEVPAWVHPKHRKTLLTQEVVLDGGTNWRAAPSKRAQVFILDRMFRMLGLGFGEDYPHIYASHPYSHRPLVEFCLGVPVSQFLRCGETRSLMRRALRERLPEKTMRRISKGLLDETIARALRREWSAVADLSEWQVCQRGYVVCSYLFEALNLARIGVMGRFGPVIRLFSLERWLRSLSRVKYTEATV